jgi:acyl-CoA synthetase (AMP-forming)/AMP-acid ligase II
VLIDLLRRAAAQAPESPVMVSASGSLSYGDAVERAEAFGRGLRSRSIARFGVAVEAPEQILVALAGASAVGAEACTYPRDLDAEAIDGLAARLEQPVVVTNGGVALEHAEALPFATLLESGDGALGPAPEHTPVMVLTTGTTGDQKGVRHDWGRLIAGVRHPDEAGGERWLLAYNLNQFAGVQVLLHVLASRATLVAPASSQARDVIEAMRTWGVTHVSATPTFWRILVGGIDEETAAGLALRQITLGGEPSPGSLLEKLRRLFPDARISHVYAGTEVGSVVSVRDGLPGLPGSVLERGADAEVQLRIVDGELQIRSRVGMLGYHGSGDSAGEWVQTGDLVEERDGRVHFVGRTSEIINVGGAKVHPLPVEEVICSVAGVELAAVYGRPNPITGQIVAADVVAAAGIDTEGLEADIRKACAEALPRPGRPRRIRFVAELSVRGNKVLRKDAQEEES